MKTGEIILCLLVAGICSLARAGEEISPMMAGSSWYDDNFHSPVHSNAVSGLQRIDSMSGGQIPDAPSKPPAKEFIRIKIPARRNAAQPRQRQFETRDDNWDGSLIFSPVESSPPPVRQDALFGIPGTILPEQLANAGKRTEPPLFTENNAAESYPGWGAPTPEPVLSHPSAGARTGKNPNASANNAAVSSVTPSDAAADPYAGKMTSSSQANAFPGLDSSYAHVELPEYLFPTIDLQRQNNTLPPPASIQARQSVRHTPLPQPRPGRERESMPLLAVSSAVQPRRPAMNTQVVQIIPPPPDEQVAAAQPLSLPPPLVSQAAPASSAWLDEQPAVSLQPSAQTWSAPSSQPSPAIAPLPATDSLSSAMAGPQTGAMMQHPVGNRDMQPTLARNIDLPTSSSARAADYFVSEEPPLPPTIVLPALPDAQEARPALSIAAKAPVNSETPTLAPPLQPQEFTRKQIQPVMAGIAGGNGDGEKPATTPVTGRKEPPPLPERLRAAAAQPAPQAVPDPAPRFPFFGSKAKATSPIQPNVYDQQANVPYVESEPPLPPGMRF